LANNLKRRKNGIPVKPLSSSSLYADFINSVSDQAGNFMAQDIDKARNFMATGSHQTSNFMAQGVHQTSNFMTHLIVCSHLILCFPNALLI
jgi:hypothetical protein